MSRRVFVVFVLFFCLGLVLWTEVKLALFEYVRVEDRAAWQGKAEMLAVDRGGSADLVILGSSRTMAVDPRQLSQEYGIRVVNYSVGGATAPSTYFFWSDC